jgi:hypothetical protein
MRFCLFATKYCLALEHSHTLIAGLLWMMGPEAIFDSVGRKEFKKHLCAYFGENTLVFPDWHSQRHDLAVGDIAIHLYILRSKLAHGGDLRRANSDPKFPVDLIEKTDPAGFIGGSATRPYC